MSHMKHISLDDDFLDKCEAYSDLAQRHEAIAARLASFDVDEDPQRLDLEDALEDNRAERLVLMWKILEVGGADGAAR